MKCKILPLFALFIFTSLQTLAAKKSYQYFRVGNASNIVTSTTGGTVLMGGGTDVDAAFQWMCARSGGGDFLVIRATGTDAYNPYIQALCPNENSVATLIIPSTAGANDPFVASTVRSAAAIFIAGGDQSDYIQYWTGTPVQTALSDAIAHGVPIGGTSAGMNVLTPIVYSALLSQGVTSSQALANPFTRYITFAQNFVSIGALGGLIGDPHFDTRDRMGRDLAFLCRIWTNNWSNIPNGISVDEATALLVTSAGAISLVGSGSAYFLRAPGPPQVCTPGTPLTYTNVSVYRIGSGGTFKLSTWAGTGGVAYTVSATAGVLSSTQASGDIY